MEKERERNINVWLPLMWPPLGTWPVTQLEIKPATLQFTAHAQFTEPHQLGQDGIFYILFLKVYLIDYAITVVPFSFSPLSPSALPPSLRHSPP